MLGECAALILDPFAARLGRYAWVAFVRALFQRVPTTLVVIGRQRRILAGGYRLRGSARCRRHQPCRMPLGYLLCLFSLKSTRLSLSRLKLVAVRKYMEQQANKHNGQYTCLCCRRWPTRIASTTTLRCRRFARVRREIRVSTIVNQSNDQ